MDIRNLVRNKIHICKEYHIQPSEIDRMPYYEYEYVIEEINNDIKEEEKRRKEEEKNRDSSMSGIPNYNSMMSSMKNSMPSFKAPKI